MLEVFLNKVIEMSATVGGKLLAAILVFAVGMILIKCVVKALRKNKLGERADPTVRSFLINVIRVSLYVLLFVTLIAIMGVPMASIVTVIASAGVTVGLALQGSLSNLAGGIMLLMFRPFKLGDFIDASGFSGTVMDIGIFYTTLKTGDNKAITIPNGSLMNDSVINYSVHPTRRLDLTFGVAYGTDVERVKAILLEEAGKHEKVQQDPTPFCRLSKQSESSLDILLRVWVDKNDYWQVNFDLLEQVTARFVKEGIEIPFHQMDVHIKKD